MLNKVAGQSIACSNHLITEKVSICTYYQLCFIACLLCVVLSVPLDEVIDKVFNSLLHLRFLQRDRVTLIGDLHNQLPQFVQLTLDLEETLCCQSKPARGQVRGG